MKIYVAGHRGLVGSAICSQIDSTGKHTWIGAPRSTLDLSDRNAVFNYIAAEQPEAVVIAAARVGGIVANETFPVEFLSENLQIQTNILDACHASAIKRVLFLGSSCIYPKHAPQPIKESHLLTGLLEKTNEAYAIAKIAGVKLVEAYRKEYGYEWSSAMPTNLYGPGDNFDPETSHVLPALIHKIYLAKQAHSPEIRLWGTGSPLRELLHVSDLAKAVIILLERESLPSLINVGSAEEISIRDLAELVCKQLNYSGKIVWDDTRPNGTPRKLLDSTLIRELGWKPEVSLEVGIQSTIRWFEHNVMHDAQS